MEILITFFMQLKYKYINGYKFFMSNFVMRFFLTFFDDESKIEIEFVHERFKFIFYLGTRCNQ